MKASDQHGISLILTRLLVAGFIALKTVGVSALSAEERYTNIIRPGGSPEVMAETSKGCLDCHTKTDSPTMHENPAVHIGCAQCHGGDPSVRAEDLAVDSAQYSEAKKKAHVLPLHPEKWPSSANPKHSYTDLL